MGISAVYEYGENGRLSLIYIIKAIFSYHVMEQLLG